MNREHIWQSGLFPEEIVHGSTTKAFGVFRFGRVPDQEALKSRESFARAVEISRDRFVFAEQVHGNNVVVATAPIPQEQATKADAIVTKTPNLMLIIKTADCVPVFFYDPQTNAAGVAHGGWRGVAADIIGATIKKMAAEFGSKPQNLFVAFGPAICAEHYDVTTAKDDRVHQFEKLFGQESGAVVRKSGKIAFDLPQACKELCVKHGVKPGNIQLSGVCTYEQPDLWASYRREGERLSHDIWSFISLKS
jgi:polyphenol oxidase